MGIIYQANDPKLVYLQRVADGSLGEIHNGSYSRTFSGNDRIDESEMPAV